MSNTEHRTPNTEHRTPKTPLPFIYHRRVNFSETDMAGIVHFANYYRWMEEAEHELFRSVGLSIMEPLPKSAVPAGYLGWPRVSSSLHYESPAHYNDIIVIGLSIERMGFKSIAYVCEMHRDGRRIAHGRMKTACCHCFADGTLQSVEIPAEIRGKLPPPTNFVAE